MEQKNRKPISKIIRPIALGSLAATGIVISTVSAIKFQNTEEVKIINLENSSHIQTLNFNDKLLKVSNKNVNPSEKIKYINEAAFLISVTLKDLEESWNKDYKYPIIQMSNGDIISGGSKMKLNKEKVEMAAKEVKIFEQSHDKINFVFKSEFFRAILAKINKFIKQHNFK
ncbi:hypothetical protein MYMA111404_02905 [Mycoplasma marinum]|uniref:Uncharacterized protein n=1 Tax=Mycoplasma marinum TaxID=1937190 RepID=A0A4R0XP55_9MOLU|nr:hypothetical protein [Mycoplasma marinum]TCG11292.1 hypothetical protein C4B24_02495 [Mycoplasma marinum]